MLKQKVNFLYLIFENNFYILNTLGLNGGWCYFTKNKNKLLFSSNNDDYSKYFSDDNFKSYLNLTLKHLNIEFITENGSLYYFDILSFGTIKCITDSEELNSKLNKIGPDIMNESTNLELFLKQIKKKINLTKCIGLVLINQKIISGIGNYLRADVLYLSKINPFRVVKDLTDKEIEIIFNNSKILTWCVYDIKKAEKLKIYNENVKLPSDYNRLFFVYNQDKDIYGNKIKKIELYEGSQKRFIYYVPKIQI